MDKCARVFSKTHNHADFAPRSPQSHSPAITNTVSVRHLDGCQESTPTPSSLPPFEKKYMSKRKLSQWGKRYLNKRLQPPGDVQSNYIDNGDDSSDNEYSLYNLLRNREMTDFERCFRLFRPSQIVPDIKLGDRIDAGMTKQDREVHLRRLKATFLRVHNYDSNGVLMSISGATRQYHGLDQYSYLLMPPEEELSVYPRRVPKQLLSRYYRGKVLAKRFSRHFRPLSKNLRAGSTQHRQKRKPRANPSGNTVPKSLIDNQATDLEKSGNGSDSSQDINDYEYWCPSPVFEEEEQRRINTRQARAEQRAKEEATKRARDALGVPTEPFSKRHKSYAEGNATKIKDMSNKEIVIQMLREHASDDENADEVDSESDENINLQSQANDGNNSLSLDETETVVKDIPYEKNEWNTSPGAPKMSNVIDLDSKARPAKEVPLFDDLFKTLMENPEAIITAAADNIEKESNEGDSSLDSSKSKDEDETKQNADDNTEPVTNFAPPENMTVYEKEQWNSAEFSKSNPRNEMKSLSALNGSFKLSPGRQRGKSAATVEAHDQAQATSSAAWNMMKRMGFKGRLGLNEDGIVEPLPSSNRLLNNKEGVGVGMSRRIASRVGTINNNVLQPRESPSNDGYLKTRSKGGVDGTNAQRNDHMKNNIREEEGEQSNVNRSEAHAKHFNLQEEDEYETETAQRVGDNKRRGIIVDFDLLILNSEARRQKALEELQSLGLQEVGKLDLCKLVENHGRDVCDMELMSEVLKKNGFSNNARKVESMMRALDVAYEEINTAAPPKLCNEMANYFFSWSEHKRARMALFHRGSRARLEAELKATGLFEIMDNVYFGSVSVDDEWPYITSLRLLKSQLGVQAAQVTIISCVRLSDKNKGKNEARVVGGCVAASVLGTRSITIGMDSDSSKHNLIKIQDVSQKAKAEAEIVVIDDDIDHSLVENAVDLLLKELDSKGKGVIEKCMNDVWRRKKRRRVLALREQDQQFHCGVIVFGDEDNTLRKWLVEMYAEGDREWVEHDDIVGIDRRAYRILKKNAFPALLSPEDVSIFDTNSSRCNHFGSNLREARPIIRHSSLPKTFFPTTKMSSWNFSSLSVGSHISKKFTTTSCPSNDLARTNRIFVSPSDFDQTTSLATVASKYIYIVAPHDALKPSEVGFNSIQRRELRLALSDPVTVTPFTWPKNSPLISRAATFEIDLVSKKATGIDIDVEELSQQCSRHLVGFVPSLGQSFILDFFGTKLLLKAASLVVDDSTVECAAINQTSEFYFTKSPGSSLKLKGSTNESRPKDIFRPDFNFEKMGIGGLDKEFSDIFRRAFASRVFPTSVIQKLGIQHVKGMLLYGPPGTGKTLIARQIGKMLNGKEPKVVNGPEVLNKFVGQSEENIRNLFQDAENDFNENGDASELHIIIFDEIDAICKQRGMSNSSAGVGDTVVNQLLSKIDGVNSLNNILVIGMTNRKDMIDEALLRPGRLEVHVEISLPDEHGRQQILRIHTGKMKDSGMLAGDVQLESLAKQTKNYSGAEIEGVCKSAAAFALNRHVDYHDLKKEVDASGMQVTMSDFERALVEVQPAFGMGKDDFARCLLGGFLIYGERMTHALEAGKRFRNEVATSERSPLLSVLIEGPSGSGKTALAALLAVDSGFPFVRFISPESYVGFSEVGKCQALAKIFDDAHKSSLSVVVIDNIERLIEYSPIGPRFSNVVLQTLMVLTKRVPPKGRRLLILGTTSCADVLQRLDYRQSFSAVLSTGLLTGREIGTIVDGSAPSVNLSQQADGNFATLHSSRTPGVSFGTPTERGTAVSMLETEGVGVKKLLMILNMARTEGPDGRFSLSTERLSDVLRDVV